MTKINKINLKYWIYYLIEDKKYHTPLLFVVTTLIPVTIAMWLIPFSIFSLTGNIQTHLEVTIKIILTILLLLIYLESFLFILMLYIMKYKNLENLIPEELEKYNKYFNISKPEPEVRVTWR